MDVAEWLNAWLAKRSQLGPLSNEPALEVATCRQDAINDGVDLHDLQEAAGGDLVGFLGGNRVQSLHSA